MTQRTPWTAGLRRLRPLLAVGLLLTAAAVAAMLSSSPIERTPATRLPLAPIQPPTDLPSPPQLLPKTQPPDTTDVVLPGWLLLIVKGLCLAVVLTLVGLLVWYLLRNGLRMRERRSDPDLTPQLAQARQEVIAAVDAGLSDLDDSDTDPRRAVIACWVRLEQAAAAAGTARQPGDTPAELVTRLLTDHEVSAAVLYRLAEVYRLARYATHTVDAGMRDQARAALGQLRAELADKRRLAGLAQVPAHDAEVPA